MSRWTTHRTPLRNPSERRLHEFFEGEGTASIDHLMLAEPGGRVVLYREDKASVRVEIWVGGKGWRRRDRLGPRAARVLVEDLAPRDLRRIAPERHTWKRIRPHRSRFAVPERRLTRALYGLFGALLVAWFGLVFLAGQTISLLGGRFPFGVSDLAFLFLFLGTGVVSAMGFWRLVFRLPIRCPECGGAGRFLQLSPLTWRCSSCGLIRERPLEFGRRPGDEPGKRGKRGLTPKAHGE